MTASLISPIAYLATREDKLPLLFVSERGQPMTRQAVNYLIREAGERAKLGRVWPHMLRHSAGYALSNRGTDFRVLQDFLGHRDPRHTTRYTRTASRRFEGALEIEHRGNVLCRDSVIILSSQLPLLRDELPRLG